MPSDDVAIPQVEAIKTITPNRQSGRELYFIAGLSLANTLLAVLAVNVSLVFGLSSTLIAAYVFDPLIAVVLTLVGAGTFAVLGLATSKGYRWALAIAIVLYVLDTALAVWAVVVVGDKAFIIDLFAHAFIGYMLVKGYLASRPARATPTV